MVLRERNQLIRDIKRLHPELTDEQIGRMFLKGPGDDRGLSRQRVNKIVRQPEKCGIISITMESEYIINGKLNPDMPIAATMAAELTKIPYWAIAKWVKRGKVKVKQHPGHAAPGKPVLLDPVSLQAQIDRYRPRKKKELITA